MDWQFGDVLLAMLFFFAWVLWFWLLFTVFGDLFRRRDIGGGAKTGWVVFVIVLPFLGCFIYLISQGTGMGERHAEAVRSAHRALDDQVRAAAGTRGVASEIETAKRLLDDGTISQEEFDAIKARVLAT